MQHTHAHMAIIMCMDRDDERLPIYTAYKIKINVCLDMFWLLTTLLRVNLQHCRVHDSSCSSHIATFAFHFDSMLCVCVCSDAFSKLFGNEPQASTTAQMILMNESKYFKQRPGYFTVCVSVWQLVWQLCSPAFRLLFVVHVLVVMVIHYAHLCCPNYEN